MKGSYTDKVGLAPTGTASTGRGLVLIFNEIMNLLIKVLVRFGLLTRDLDYHLLRASMVIIYFFFGYQKWFPYEAHTLVPFIGNSPLMSWMYPVFGIQGASWFLGVSEWLFGALLFLGFWNKKLGILGAAGSCVTFIMTVTIIPFMPDGWAASAGGFPAMQGNVAFLMKDVVLFAVSVYLLRQDVERASLSA
jgi:Predicted membrane protein